MLTPDEIVANGLQLNFKSAWWKGRGGETIQAGSFILEYKTHAVYKRREMNGIKQYDANDKGSYIIEAQTKKGRVIGASMP